MIATYIKIRFEFEGIHCWPEAPEQVSFLKNSHRHLFKVEAVMNVHHHDREMEFFIVKKDLQELVKTLGFDLGRMSCEDMAHRIYQHIRFVYNRSFVRVEVSEDGENAAIIEWKMPQ